jgi:hypothetical protein
VTGFSTTATATYSPGGLTFSARQITVWTGLSMPPCGNQDILNTLGKSNSTFLLQIGCSGAVTFNVSAHPLLPEGLYVSQTPTLQSWATYCQNTNYDSAEEFRLVSENVPTFSASATLPCNGPSAAIRTPWVSVRGRMNYFNAPTCSDRYYGAEFNASVRFVCTFNYLP